MEKNNLRIKMAIYSHYLEFYLFYKQMAYQLATGSIEYSIEEVTRLKSITNKLEVQYCIDDCLFHLRKAKETLKEGLKDPKEWMKDSQEVAKLCLAMIPFLLLMKDQNLLGNQNDSQSVLNNSRVVNDRMDEV